MAHRLYPVAVRTTQAAATRDASQTTAAQWVELNRYQIARIHQMSIDQAQVRAGLNLIPQFVLNSNIVVTVDGMKSSSESIELSVNSRWRLALHACIVETYKYGVSVMCVNRSRDLVCRSVYSTPVWMRVHADGEVEYEIDASQGTAGSDGGFGDSGGEEEKRIRDSVFFLVVTDPPEFNGGINSRARALVEAETYVSHVIRCTMLSSIYSSNPAFVVEQKETAAPAQDPNRANDRHLALDSEALSHVNARRAAAIEQAVTRSMLAKEFSSPPAVSVQPGAEEFNVARGPEGLRTHPNAVFRTNMPARTIIMPAGKSISAAPVGEIAPQMIRDSRDGLARDVAGALSLPIAMFADSAYQNMNTTDAQWSMFNNEMRAVRDVLVSLIRHAVCLAFPDEVAVTAMINSYWKIPRRSREVMVAHGMASDVAHRAVRTGADPYDIVKEMVLTSGSGSLSTMLRTIADGFGGRKRVRENPTVRPQDDNNNGAPKRTKKSAAPAPPPPRKQRTAPKPEPASESTSSSDKDKEKPSEDEDASSSSSSDDEDEDEQGEQGRGITIEDLGKVNVYFAGIGDPAALMKAYSTGLITSDGIRKLYIEGYLGVPNEYTSDKPLDPNSGRTMESIEQEEKDKDERRYKDSLNLQKKTVEAKSVQSKVKTPPIRSGRIGERPPVMDKKAAREED